MAIKVESSNVQSTSQTSAFHSLQIDSRSSISSPVKSDALLGSWETYASTTLGIDFSKHQTCLAHPTKRHYCSTGTPALVFHRTSERGSRTRCPAFKILQIKSFIMLSNQADKASQHAAWGRAGRYIQLWTVPYCSVLKFMYYCGVNSNALCVWQKTLIFCQKIGSKVFVRKWIR